MASFSFGAGNARKLAALPLYALGRLATIAIPRVPGTWAFGCGAGIGDGALAMWERVAADGAPAVWVIGTAREAADAAARGIPTVRRGSLRAFWRTARAQVVVVTHGFGDVDRYAVSGAFVVQLWHGVPLKRIGLDSPATLRVPSLFRRPPVAGAVRALLAAMFRSAARRIRVLPAASHAVRGRLESAFALPDDRVPVTGEPRVDVLSRGTASSRRSAARAEIARLTGPLDPATRLVLYAPTWRDGAPDPAVPTSAEWPRILDALGDAGAVLLVRSHPLGAGDYEPAESTDRVRRLGSDLVRDVTPLLPGVDALVTDYSSLVFDAALVPLPVIFLAPDVDEYARTRGFFGRYADLAGSDVATGWGEAAAQVAAVLTDDDERQRRLELSRERSRAVHAFRDGGNADRVYRAILAGIGARRPTKGTR